MKQASQKKEIIEKDNKMKKCKENINMKESLEVKIDKKSILDYSPLLLTIDKSQINKLNKIDNNPLEKLLNKKSFKVCKAKELDIITTSNLLGASVLQQSSNIFSYKNAVIGIKDSEIKSIQSTRSSTRLQNKKDKKTISLEAYQKNPLEIDSQLMTDIKQRRNKAIAIKDKKYINQLLSQEYFTQQLNII